jgi:hypothetical protein
MIKTKLILSLLILLAAAGAAIAQHGGKAEPNEIKFAKGKSSATVSNTLSGDQQAEYSFTARAGQTVSIKCSPQFDFRLWRPVEDDSEAEFDTEWNSGTDSFELPADGQYLLYVRKKMRKVRSGRFTLTITIK